MVSAEQPLNFFDYLDSIQQQFLVNKQPLLFLDYDGTLTPIVETPDLAILTDEMRQFLNNLAQKYSVAIVSGRATDDVSQKVNLPELYYAGSHGFEILKPDGTTEINQEALKIKVLIDQLYESFSKDLAHITGILVEHVKYTLTVHYRRVEEKFWPEIKNVVAEKIVQYPELKMTEGKMIFEVRPNLDWHKGKAVQWILQEWNYDPSKHCPIYIGDDMTDEDAFEFLADKGFGIHVADEPRPTKARYFVPSVAEVKQVLEKLEELCPTLPGN